MGHEIAVRGVLGFTKQMTCWFLFQKQCHKKHLKESYSNIIHYTISYIQINAH